MEPVFRAGEAFPHDPAITETEAEVTWVEQNQARMVALDAVCALVGTHYLRPNSLALGAHVAMPGVWWLTTAGGRESAAACANTPCRRPCGWGFRALQFYLVVSTDTAGIRCWQRNGFQIVGTLPGAFRHRQLADVDALVMIQTLLEESTP
jgi:hypothetical protein